MNTIRLTHEVPFALDPLPGWVAAVPRWQQIDPASFGLVDAWHTWRERGEPKDVLNPDVFILAQPLASNWSDFRFARSGAYSPARFVSTVPNVSIAAMLQLTGWTGRFVCVQSGPATRELALAEAALLIRAGEARRVGIVAFAIAGVTVQVDYRVMGPTA